MMISGFKDDDTLEMMRQVSAYKLGGVEAAVRVMNEEASMKLVMGLIGVKVAKNAMAAVVLIMLVLRFSTSLLNLLNLN